LRMWWTMLESWIQQDICILLWTFWKALC
jgi:hypothetical protein